MLGYLDSSSANAQKKNPGDILFTSLRKLLISLKPCIRLANVHWSIYTVFTFSRQGRTYALSAQNTLETERPLNNFSTPGRVEDVFSGLRKHQRLCLLKESMAGPWRGTGWSHTCCPVAVVPV